MATEKVKCRILASGVAKITQEFIAGGKHNGIDIVGFDGKVGIVDDILAHSEGEVVEALDGIGEGDNKHELGNYVRIRHDDKYETLYAHLKKGTVLFKKGDKVSKGQKLGRMGNTGTSKSSGVHLHFVVYESKKRINPKQYLNADLPVNPNNIKCGDMVMVRKGATNVKGVVLADWVFESPILVISEPSLGKVKIGKIDSLGIKHTTAVMWVRDLTIAEVSTIKAGDKVVVKKGAKNVNGIRLASWVYEYKFTVMEEPKNGKVKIGKVENNTIKKTATVYLKDVYEV